VPPISSLFPPERSRNVARVEFEVDVRMESELKGSEHVPVLPVISTDPMALLNHFTNETFVITLYYSHAPIYITIAEPSQKRHRGSDTGSSQRSP